MKRKSAWKQVLGAWKKKDVALALLRVRRYLDTSPEDFVAWALLGDILGDLGRYREGRTAIAKAITLWPGERKDWVYTAMADLYRKKGANRIAERWYRKAVELDPSALNLIFLGAILQRQGRLKEAKSYQQRAAKRKSDLRDEALYNLGLIARGEEDFGRAENYFRRAIEIDPKYALAKAALRDVERANRLLRRDTKTGQRRKR